ncbi:UNVERIFIED_CONTAM: hypothetical protein Sangu_1705300 [Sesamum angustifolium]|uniref:Uncharacterized protein n=1 Tax=Sesamum angustifolium TaxID=2727405 RepID=A0AAW2MM84_9LAMI
MCYGPVIFQMETFSQLISIADPHSLGIACWRLAPCSVQVPMASGLGKANSCVGRPLAPSPLLFRPITPAPALLANLHVADLIDPESRDWNVSLIQEVFWPQDSEVILSIPISVAGDEDLLIWHYSRNSIFSVQSAYHLACSLDDRPCSSSLKT